MVILDRLCVLTYCLDVDANRRHFSCLLNVDSILVDSLDNDGLEITIPVRSKHHLLVYLKSSLQHCTTKNQTDTLAEVSRVNNKLCMDMRRLGLNDSLWVLLLISSDWLRAQSLYFSLLLTRVLSHNGHWHAAEELLQELDTLTSASRDREDGAYTTGSNGLLAAGDIGFSLHHNWDSVAIPSHNVSNLLQVLLVNLAWSNIDLGEYNENW